MWDIGIGTFLEWRWIVFLCLLMLGALILILGSASLLGHWRGRRRR